MIHVHVLLMSYMLRCAKNDIKNRFTHVCNFKIKKKVSSDVVLWNYETFDINGEK